LKLVNHFNEFLKSEVNLNQSRIYTLEKRVAAITSFISSNASLENILL
jgi:hypothetical protein